MKKINEYFGVDGWQAVGFYSIFIIPTVWMIILEVVLRSI
jgi:hypothetical protein